MDRTAAKKTKIGLKNKIYSVFCFKPLARDAAAFVLMAFCAFEREPSTEAKKRATANEAKRTKRRIDFIANFRCFTLKLFGPVCGLEF